MQPTFANPLILTIVSTDHNDQVITRRIKGMKKICHYTQQSEPSSKYYELIVVAKLVE